MGLAEHSESWPILYELYLVNTTWSTLALKEIKSLLGIFFYGIHAICLCIYTISHSSHHLFNKMIDSRSKLTVGIWHSSNSRIIAFFAVHSFPDNPRWPRTQQKIILKKWLFKWSALVNMHSTKIRSVFKASIAWRHDLDSVKIIQFFCCEFRVYSKAKC